MAIEGKIRNRNGKWSALDEAIQIAWCAGAVAALEAAETAANARKEGP